jgi:hypothetical protein
MYCKVIESSEPVKNKPKLLSSVQPVICPSVLRDAVIQQVRFPSALCVAKKNSNNWMTRSKLKQYSQLRVLLWFVKTITHVIHLMEAGRVNDIRAVFGRSPDIIAKAKAKGGNKQTNKTKQKQQANHY